MLTTLLTLRSDGQRTSLVLRDFFYFFIFNVVFAVMEPLKKNHRFRCSLLLVWMHLQLALTGGKTLTTRF